MTKSRDNQTARLTVTARIIHAGSAPRGEQRRTAAPHIA
jgi:hypothetical protein